MTLSWSHPFDKSSQVAVFDDIHSAEKKGTVHNDITGRTLGVFINSASFNPFSALCVHAELILLIVFNSNLHNFLKGVVLMKVIN